MISLLLISALLPPLMACRGGLCEDKPPRREKTCDTSFEERCKTEHRKARTDLQRLLADARREKSSLESRRSTIEHEQYSNSEAMLKDRLVLFTIDAEVRFFSKLPERKERHYSNDKVTSLSQWLRSPHDWKLLAPAWLQVPSSALDWPNVETAPYLANLQLEKDHLARRQQVLWQKNTDNEAQLLRVQQACRRLNTHESGLLQRIQQEQQFIDITCREQSCH